MNADLEKKFLLNELPEQREKIMRRVWCPSCRTKLGRPKRLTGSDAFLQSDCKTCGGTGTVDGSVTVGAS
jgi:hypothetical protein